MGGGRGRVKGCIPSSRRPCRKAKRKSIAYLIQYYYQFPSSLPHSHQEGSSQMEEGSGFHLALQHMQGINQAGVQLEWELAHEVQRLARKYEDEWITLSRKHGVMVSPDNQRGRCHLSGGLLSDKLN